jgi:hypothetical protein
MPATLHPAENRGYRELYAFGRQLASHWSALAERLAPEERSAFERGVERTNELLEALVPVTARYGLHGKPAAQGVGVSIASGRAAVRDRFLERNQALRLAVQDIQHLTALLGYLAAVAKSRSDSELAEFCLGWERKLRRVESDARKVAVEAGTRPDSAIEPLDGSPLGRAAHKAGYAMGTVGEWLDKRTAERRGV